MTHQVEFDVRVIPINNDMQKKVTELSKEGWEIVPTALPVAVYWLQRVKRDSTVAEHVGVGQLNIDDSKIKILRDGKIIDG